MFTKRITRLSRGTLFILLFAVAGIAQAHKVNLFAYAEGDQVYVEGYFVDGKKARNSKVIVQDMSEKVLHEGTTDSEGQFTFPVPIKADLKIIVNAGMGHQTDFVIPASELSGAVDSVEITESSDYQDQTENSNESSSVSRSEAMSSVTNIELEKAVRHAVNEAIKPLVRELSVAQKKAKLSEIVSAVGYILGLFGLFAFMKAREKTKE